MSSLPVQPQDWQPPPELDQPLPRCVASHRQAKHHCYAIAIPLALITIIMLSFLGINLYKNIKFRNNSALTTGQIKHAEFHTGKHRNFYTVTYVFSTADQTPITDTGRIDEANIPASNAPHDIFIVYDPRNPRHNMPAVSLAQDNRDIFHLSCFIIIANILFATISIRNIYNWPRWLLKYGRIAQAHSFSEETYRSRSGTHQRLIYHFTTCYGQDVVGQLDAFPPSTSSLATSREYRDQIFKDQTVLYDPLNSSRNILYPLKLFTCMAPSPSQTSSDPKNP